MTYGYNMAFLGDGGGFNDRNIEHIRCTGGLVLRVESV